MGATSWLGCVEGLFRPCEGSVYLLCVLAGLGYSASGVVRLAKAEVRDPVCSMSARAS